MSANERLIADIMAAQRRLQDVFVQDRADPLFETPLTMQQLKILMLLHRLGGTSGRELAGLMHVSLATLSGMIDRLVAHDWVLRSEDPHDRRVRRLTLTEAGHAVVDKIANAGADLQRRLLNRLTDTELETVLGGLTAMIRAADDAACPPATSPASTAPQTAPQTARPDADGSGAAAQLGADAHPAT